MTPQPKPRRHKWGNKVKFPLEHKSERECLNGCGIVKVTRHEDRALRVEFWRGMKKIGHRWTGTPVCEMPRDAA